MSSYIDWYHSPRDTYRGATGTGVRHSWEVHTFNALSWQYGPSRAMAIVGGRDPQTQADIARWNKLGTVGAVGEQSVNLRIDQVGPKDSLAS